MSSLDKPQPFYEEGNKRSPSHGEGHLSPTAHATTGFSVDNVLSHIPRDVLLVDVDAFVTAHGFEGQAECFQKGAFVAQNPSTWREISELSVNERNALEHEEIHKWSQPFALYFTGGPTLHSHTDPSSRLCYWSCLSGMGSDRFERCK